MPIKNYTTTISADCSIDEIKKSLIDHGAIGILMEYEKGNGRIEALKFMLEINDNKISFKMPTNWRKFQEVLRQQEIKRCEDEDYCYRVAWRNIRDWVLSQMALLETEMIELPQIFLSFVMDGEQTLYEKIKDNQFLLSDGK